MHYKNLQIIATKFIKTVINNYRMNLFTSGLVPSALIIRVLSIHGAFLAFLLAKVPQSGAVIFHSNSQDSHPGDNY
jgi:hypothetical protein